MGAKTIIQEKVCPKCESVYAHAVSRKPRVKKYLILGADQYPPRGKTFTFFLLPAADHFLYIRRKQKGRKEGRKDETISSVGNSINLPGSPGEKARMEPAMPVTGARDKLVYRGDQS